MIAYLGEWIKHIILLILIATFLDLLLPNSSMRRYVKLVVGLLLILVILSPVLHIFQFDYERLLAAQEEWTGQGDSIFAEKMSISTARIEAWQEEAILEEVATTWGAEMKAQIEDKYDVHISDLQLKLAARKEEVDIIAVSLVLESQQDAERNGHQQVNTEKDQQQVNAQVTGQQLPRVEPIKPVIIDVKPKVDERFPTKENSSRLEKKIEQEVLTYLSEEWNISVDKMTCTWVRR